MKEAERKYVEALHNVSKYVNPPHRVRQQSPVPDPRPDPVEALNVQMQRLQGNMSQLRDATAKLQASYEQLDVAHRHLKHAVINLQLALQRGDKHE